MPLQVLDRPFPSPDKNGSKTLQKAQRKAPGPAQSVQNEEPLPNLPDIEKATIQVIFANAEAGFSMFEQSARSGFFVNPINREIFNIARAFYSEQGRLDWIAFTTHLERIGRFEALGAHAYITDLFVPLGGSAPPFEVLPYYIRQLSECYVRRQVIMRSFATVSKAKTSEIGDLIADMSRSVDDLRIAATGKVTLCDATRYLNGHCPAMPSEIVYGLLHQGSKMVVGGTSKGRKTMALIDLAVSVTTGSEWWGFGTKQGPICYINFEIQEPFFWYRVEQVCNAKGVEISPGMFFAWNLRGRAAGLEFLRDEILGVLKQKPFVLIIIDPIYKGLGDRDENRAGDVASMLNEVEKIAVQTGASVAFGAHYSKGNQSEKDSIDRIGGSGVFARDPDSILTMTAHEEEECFTVEGTLRNFPPMYPFVIKWDWPLFVRKDADPNKLKKSRGTAGQFERKFPESLLLDQLSLANGLKPKEACARLKESNDVSRRTVYNMKETLESKKLLKVEDGLWYRMPGEIE